jgi:L-threonylcarbamoyladenylate synthase
MQENSELSYTLQQEVEKAASIIRRGRVILYPTDTIWGLGCDIYNESAVKRIYEIKERPSDKPFILLVSSIEMLKRYIVDIHPRVETLLTHHVQPLTIIYEANEELPPYLVAPDGTVAIRVTHDPFCKALIHLIDQPIISTSANVSNEDFPTSFDMISPQILEMTDDIIHINMPTDGERAPSVIASFNHKGELEILRG